VVRFVDFGRFHRVQLVEEITTCWLIHEYAAADPPPFPFRQMPSGQIVFASIVTEFQVLPRKSLAFLGSNRRPDVALKI
jgi:hypothetical protein